MQPQTIDDGALLSVRHVGKRFDGVIAIDDLSFDLQAGEILGLIGPNGAGKTTLFDCLAGNFPPSSGEILLQGRAIEALPAHRRPAFGLARTFQIPRPFPELSVLENAMLGAQSHAGEHIMPNWLNPRGVARQEALIRKKAADVLAYMTLDKLASKPARILSGGQKKLLELARVLMAEPSLILLDEPAAGVNPSLLEVIIDRILELNRGGTAFLLIEHNMDMVARLCGRVLVMAQGRLLAEGAPGEIVEDKRVLEAYLGGVPA